MRTIVAFVCLTSVSCTSPYPNAIPEMNYVIDWPHESPDSWYHLS